jgi:hypothetical protein
MLVVEQHLGERERVFVLASTDEVLGGEDPHAPLPRDRARTRRRSGARLRASNQPPTICGAEQSTRSQLLIDAGIAAR